MAKWHCMIAGEKQGPFSTSQLRQLAAEGRLEPDDLIIREGMTEWAKASKARGLFPAASDGDVSQAHLLAEESPPPETNIPQASTSPDQPRTGNRKMLAVVLAGVVLVAGAGGGIFWMTRQDDAKSSGKSARSDVIGENGTNEKAVPWPPDTGYVTPPEHKPESPHKVKPARTKADILAVNGSQFLLNGPVEYRESKSLLVFPGARIRYMCKSPVKFTLADYNGDNCVLTQGLTVRVDQYGQFVLISAEEPTVKTDDTVTKNQPQTPAKTPAKVPALPPLGELKARTVSPAPSDRTEDLFWFEQPRKALSRKAHDDVRRILIAYLKTFARKTQTVTSTAGRAQKGAIFEVTDGKRTFRGRIESSITARFRPGKPVVLSPPVKIRILNDWMLSDGIHLPPQSTVYGLPPQGTWEVGRRRLPDKGALGGLVARTVTPLPSDVPTKPVRLESKGPGLSRDAQADVYRILAAYLKTHLPADPSKTYVVIKKAAVFDVMDGKRTYRGRVKSLAGHITKGNPARLARIDVTALNDWVLPDGTTLPAHSVLSSSFSGRMFYVRRPATRAKPTKTVRTDTHDIHDDKPAAWRTDIAAFTREVARVAKRSHIPSRRQLLDSLRTRKVFTNSAGKPILVVLEPLLDDELHGELSKAFSGRVFWSGKIKTIKKTKDGKSYDMEIAWPIPKDLPKHTSLRDTLLITVSAKALGQAGVPQKGDTFAFTGELKKPKPDSAEPVWVFYSLYSQKHAVGVTPINVRASDRPGKASTGGTSKKPPIPPKPAATTRPKAKADTGQIAARVRAAVKNDPAAPNVLVASLQSEDAAVWEVALAIVKERPGDAAAKILQAAFDKGNLVARQRLVMSAWQIGPACLPLVSKSLQSEDQGLQSGAMYSLVKLGSAAVPTLVKLLDSDDPRLTRIAASVASRIGLPAAVAVRKAARHSDETTRNNAAHGLRLLPPDHTKRVNHLIRLTESPDPKVRTNAAWELGRLGRAALPAMDALMTLVKDPSLSCRQKAAMALGGFGADAAQAVPLIIPLLKERKSKHAGIKALGMIGPPAIDAVVHIEPFLKDRNPQVRALAAEAIKAIKAR